MVLCGCVEHSCPHEWIGISFLPLIGVIFPVVDQYTYQVQTHTHTQFGVDDGDHDCGLVLPWILCQHPWPQGHDVGATVVTASATLQQERR